MPARFKRRLGERRYRRLFIIATEGSETERQYFSLFNDANNIVKIQCLTHKTKTSPDQVLKRLVEYLNRQGLGKRDWAWIVVDTDNWAVAALQKCHEWSKKAENFGFAVSNPKFEFWLLLHFEDAGTSSSKECSARLQRHIPDYNKHLPARSFPLCNIRTAVTRARRRDAMAVEAWPTSPGTTVYKLVERLLEEI